MRAQPSPPKHLMNARSLPTVEYTIDEVEQVIVGVVVGAPSRRNRRERPRVSA